MIFLRDVVISTCFDSLVGRSQLYETSVFVIGGTAAQLCFLVDCSSNDHPFGSNYSQLPEKSPSLVN